MHKHDAGAVDVEQPTAKSTRLVSLQWIPGGRGQGQTVLIGAAGHTALGQRLSCQAMWGATMDVGGWLRGLGLGQYETNFRDNKIDADLLPRLTNDVLKDIGVAAAGDRLRLLDAIAALAGAKRVRRRLRFPLKVSAAEGSRSLG